MWAEIMARVCGVEVSALQSRPAWLEGHVRHPVRGQEYPGLVPLDERRQEPGGVAAEPLAVRGVLYDGLTDEAYRRLDAFEGEEYERVRVRVREGAPDGAWRQAWVYRFRAAYRHRLAPGAWDPDRFEAEGKARFLARYGGFDRPEG